MGSFTANTSRDSYDERNRYIENICQEGIPVVDSDLNEWMDSIYNQVRRLSQTSFSDIRNNDAFLIVGDASTNDFNITGGDGTLDGAANFYVNGHRVFLLSDITYASNPASGLAGEDQRSIYPKVTNVSYASGPNETTITDSSANYVVNELAGRVIVPDVETPGNTYTVVSNTATGVVVSGDQQANVTVGNRYRVNLSTPSGSARTDGVYLNVFVDEIDSVEDTNLKNDVDGVQVETQARKRLEHSIFVREDITTHGELTDYTDSDGNDHYVVKLAELARADADATITSGMVTDSRPSHRITDQSVLIKSDSDSAFDVQTSGGISKFKVDTNNTELYIPSGTRLLINDGGATFHLYNDRAWMESSATNYRFGINQSNPPSTFYAKQEGTAAAVAVASFDQDDIDEPFFKFIGESTAADATQSLVDHSGLASYTGSVSAWIRNEIQDDANNITDGDYFVPHFNSPADLAILNATATQQFDGPLRVKNDNATIFEIQDSAGNSALDIINPSTNPEIGLYNNGTDKFYIRHTGSLVSLVGTTNVQYNATLHNFVTGNVTIHSSVNGAPLSVKQPGSTTALPVTIFDQGDVSEPFIKFIGESSLSDATQSLVDHSVLGSFSGSVSAWVRNEIQDEANNITDGDYFVPHFSSPADIAILNETATQTFSGELILAAGTTTSTPLKLQAGTNLTTPEAGAFEFDGKSLMFTQSTDRHSFNLSDMVLISDTTVSNSAVEETVYSGTVSANELYKGSLWTVVTSGHYSTANGTDTFTLRLKIGGNTVETFTSDAGSVTNAGWHTVFNFTVRSEGVSGTEISTAWGIFNDAAKISSETTTSTIDTTSSNNIEVTVQWDNALAGNSFTITQGITEIKGKKQA